MGRPARALRAVRNGVRGYRYGKSLDPGNPAESWTPLDDSFQRQSGVWKWRHYLAVHDRHLSRFRGTGCVLLEIGVLGGGSLAMWRDYLGPRAVVCGADIDPACAGPGVFIGDQADPAFLEHIKAEMPGLDIVIDDGGHLPFQQVATFEALFPHLSPGGVYAIEDIHGPNHGFHWYLDGLARQLSAMAPVAFGSVHRYPHLAVVEKSAVRVSDERR